MKPFLLGTTLLAASLLARPVQAEPTSIPIPWTGSFGDTRVFGLDSSEDAFANSISAALTDSAGRSLQDFYVNHPTSVHLTARSRRDVPQYLRSPLIFSPE